MLLLFQPKMALIWEWPMISDAGYFLSKTKTEGPKQHLLVEVLLDLFQN